MRVEEVLNALMGLKNESSPFKKDASLLAKIKTAGGLSPQKMKAHTAAIAAGSVTASSLITCSSALRVYGRYCDSQGIQHFPIVKDHPRTLRNPYESAPQIVSIIMTLCFPLVSGLGGKPTTTEQHMAQPD